jgi:hypothetical protein
MEVCTKFSVLDRAFTWGKDEQSITFLQEVMIEGITINYDLDDNGEANPQTSYLVRKGLGEDSIWIDEREVFENEKDFISNSQKMFENRKLTYPKIVDFQNQEVDKVA